MAPIPALGSSPPSRKERSTCWAARDAYFSCLDKNGLWLEGLKPETPEEVIHLDPIRPPVRLHNDRSLTKEEKNLLFTCHSFKLLFEKDCLPSWVSHFSMLRVKDTQKEFLMRYTQEKEEKLQGEGFRRFLETSIFQQIIAIASSIYICAFIEVSFNKSRRQIVCCGSAVPS
ncbi:hypothetical protein BC829DRAFT_376931 [Chytridium lagenaria]|nr:hypothetical protein BC829DRAFT_376931 [Chytridium lagenaria]